MGGRGLVLEALAAPLGNMFRVILAGILADRRGGGTTLPVKTRSRFGASLLLLSMVATPPARAAEVVRIGPGHSRGLPGGKEADAIAGDFLIRSRAVAATIGGVAAFRDASVNTQGVQG